MNYNNPYNNPYYNPYQQYPYTQYQQQNYQQQQVQPQMQQQQPQQTNYLPLTFVNGIEGAKAFIVNPNQVIYLKDSDSNLLFEKKADAQGKYTITAFELKQIDYSRPVQKPVETPVNYATIDDLTKLQVRLENMINELKSKEIKQDE